LYTNQKLIAMLMQFLSYLQKRKKMVLSSTFFFFFSVFSFAQQKILISGRILADGNIPISSASVSIKGSSGGTTTDTAGHFSIPVASGSTLVFSSVGYEEKQVRISAAAGDLRIQLASSAANLSETVVVGYGTQRKSDLTGAVGSVKAKSLEERSSTSVAQALAGRIAGVNVSVNSGRPGGNPNIRIRGNTSISITNDPLYIVDGVISTITFLDPNDIASIEVLKDASSTSIYGARGSNGVVLVTTKRGSSTGGKVNYSTQISVGKLPREIPVLNSQEYLHLEDVSYQNAQKYDSSGWNAGAYTEPKLKRTNPLLFDGSGNPLYNTDWQKEATQNAFTQNHNLSFVGGNDKSSYGVYLGYRNEQGLIKTSTLKRYSARFVFDSQVKSWLKVGGSLGYNDQTENQIDFGTSSIEVLREILEQLPIIPVKFPDGSWASNANYPNVENAPNPIQILTDQTYVVKNQNVLGNVYANVSLAKGLEFRSTVGANILNRQTNQYAGRNLNFISAAQGGIATVTSTKTNFWQLDNYLTYNKRFSSDHSLTALLGMETQHSDIYAFSAATYNFQDDFFQTNNLGVGSIPQPPTSSKNAYALNSYFARANYGYRGKYLVTFSGRTDGSSKFGASNQYAFFPSGALAWKASEEDFFKDIAVISNLKLRASYGYTGNSEIAAYQALAGLGNYSVIFNNTRTSGVSTGRLPNPALQWEKTAQADFGLELGLFKNRIALEVDLYNKLTNNMLLSAPIPASTGYTIVTENVGSMRNRGIEFNLNTANILSRDFSWNTTFNISLNKNKVISLANGNADVFPGPSYVSETNIARVGQPMGSFYGYVRLGTWGTKEAAEAASYGRLPGDLKFLDLNKDGRINALDRTIIGKGIPDGYGSFINSFRYKNFDLIVDIQFMYGNDVLVLEKYVQEFRTGIANSRKTVLNAWTPDNQNTPIAQWRPTTAGYDGQQDTRMVENGSFIRGRNLLLGYTLPAGAIQKLHVNSVRLTASVQNFFLSTKYSGYDPETSTRSETYGQGIINFDYPKPRVFLLGLYVGF
jgi:TonB-linked SusC/RagA family outer membrane protein